MLAPSAIGGRKIARAIWQAISSEIEFVLSEDWAEMAFGKWHRITPTSRLTAGNSGRRHLDGHAKPVETRCGRPLAAPRPSPPDKAICRQLSSLRGTWLRPYSRRPQPRIGWRQPSTRIRKRYGVREDVSAVVANVSVARDTSISVLNCLAAHFPHRLGR